MDDRLVQEVLDRLDIAGDIAVEGFEILLRQVYVEIATRAVWMVVALFAMYVCYRAIRNLGYLGGEQIWAKGAYDEPEMAAFFTWIGAFITAGAALVNLIGIIQRLLNPEFFVIRFIFRSVS